MIAYALAASHDLYSLAVPISSHLLSYPLHMLTDELAEKIGPVYLKRLFFLHLGRLDALRRLLLPPPHPHFPPHPYPRHPRRLRPLRSQTTTSPQRPKRTQSPNLAPQRSTP